VREYVDPGVVRAYRLVDLLPELGRVALTVPEHVVDPLREKPLPGVGNLARVQAHEAVVPPAYVLPELAPQELVAVPAEPHPLAREERDDGGVREAALLLRPLDHDARPLQLEAPEHQARELVPGEVVRPLEPPDGVPRAP